MGMSVNPYVIKCAKPVVLHMGEFIAVNDEVLLPSDFTISVVDDETTGMEAVPNVHLTRQSQLFNFLAGFEWGDVELPGIRRRMRNTERFIDFLCTGTPNFIDNESTPCVYGEKETNFRKRYLPIRGASIAYTVDFLLNHDYDAILDNPKMEKDKGKSLRQVFDEVTNRDYFKLLNEAKALGWYAILFNFE